MMREVLINLLLASAIILALSAAACFAIHALEKARDAIERYNYVPCRSHCYDRSIW